MTASASADDVLDIATATENAEKDQASLQATVEMLSKEINHLLQDNERLTNQNNEHLQQIAQLQQDSASKPATPEEEQVMELKKTVQALEERVTTLVKEKLQLQSTVDALKSQSGGSKSGTPTSSGWLGGFLTKSSPPAREAPEAASTPEKSTPNEDESMSQQDSTSKETKQVQYPPPPSPNPKSQAEILAAALSEKNENNTFGKRISAMLSPKSKSKPSLVLASRISGIGSPPVDVKESVVPQSKDRQSFRREFEDFQRQQGPRSSSWSGSTATEDPLAQPTRKEPSDRRSWDLMKQASISNLFDYGKDEDDDDDSTGPAVMSDQGKFVQAAIKNKTQRKRGKLLF